MKKYSIFLVALLALGAFSHAAGGGEKKLSFTLGGGVTMPFGNLSEEHLMGFNLAGSVNFSIMKGLDLFFDVQANFFSIDTSEVGYPGYTVSGGSALCLTLLPGVKGTYKMGDKMGIYGMAGLGISINKMSDMTITGPHYTGYYSFSGETVFTIMAGGGLFYDLSPTLSLIVFEVRFVNAFTEGESASYMPIRVGLLIKA